MRSYDSSPSVSRSSRACTGAALGLVLLAALAPRQAAADDDGKLKAFFALRPFSSAVDSAKLAGDFSGFGDDVATCRAAVAAGTAAGYQPLDPYITGSGTVLWKNIGTICDEYARLTPVKDAVDKVRPLFAEMVTMRNSFKDVGSWPSGVYRTAIENGQKCIAEVDGVVKAGAPVDVKFSPNGNAATPTVTFAEAKTQCRDFVTMAEKAVVGIEAGEVAAAAAIRGKYTKVGISGDRLKYLIEANNRIVMGKGCKELDLAGKKKSAVLYEMAEAATYWVVYKMTFKGDNLVSTTEKRFNRLTSNGWRCK